MNIYKLHSKPEQLVGYEDRFNNYTFLEACIDSMETKTNYYAVNMTQNNFLSLVNDLVSALPEEFVPAVQQFPDLAQRFDEIDSLNEL